MQSTAGVSDVVALMDGYCLTREDWDSIVELSQFTGRPELVSQIPSKVTRHHHHPVYVANLPQSPTVLSPHCSVVPLQWDWSHQTGPSVQWSEPRMFSVKQLSSLSSCR